MVAGTLGTSPAPSSAPSPRGHPAPVTHWMPTTQFEENDPAASPSSLMLCSSEAIIIGLNTFSSKWPLLPATEMPVWLPMTCARKQGGGYGLGLEAGRDSSPSTAGGSKGVVRAVEGGRSRESGKARASIYKLSCRAALYR